MTLQTQLETAKKLAFKYHAGQVDKAGKNYIYHPLKVSEMCKNEKAKIAGPLHDIIEDTPVTSKDLIEAGIDPEIVQAIVLVTKKKENFSEQEYFENIKKNEIAREVKMCDLTHNMDRSRIPEPVPEYMKKKWKRYAKEYKFLNESSLTWNEL